MKSPRAVPISRLQCSLGEGLHWDGIRQILWLVDIVDESLIWLDPQSGSVGRKRMSEPIGWVLTTSHSSQVLVGLASGIALCNPFKEHEPVEWVDKTFPQEPDQRLNDAKLDNRGRVWCGSMSREDPPKPAGVLAHYALDRGKWTVVDSSYSIPNGPAFSPDFTYFLHNDSARLVTYRYEIDAEGDVAPSRSVWREFKAEDGMPDGMTFDSEGFVWIAHWGASQVCRYSSSGELDMIVRVPATNVTNVCFGGANLDRLFVSSARHGLTPQALASEPDAGSVFEILDSGAMGLISDRYAVPVTIGSTTGLISTKATDVAGQ